MRRGKGWIVSLLAVGILGGLGLPTDALPVPPGVVPASGCRTGAVLSTDEFTTTGFGQTRTVGPNQEATAGAWVLADDFIPSTSVTPTPNCPPGGIDGRPLFVVALELTPTITNWQDADIQSIKLVRDSNWNGLYEPGTDLTLQSKSGSELETTGNVLFFNGPQSPLMVIPSAGGTPAVGFGAMAILAVVEIGPNPVNNSRFGLSLEALSADVPGGAPPANVNSGFSSSRNRIGSSIRFQIVGGGSGGGGGGSTPPPGGGGSSTAQELQPYDTNGNDRLEDGEFLNTIDDWIDRQLSDNAFFAAIDIWINQSRISSAALSREPSVQTRQTAQGVRFSAPNAASLSVDVYGLDGRRVFRATTSGSTLGWRFQATSGASLANGVYLYRAAIETPDGRTVRPPIQKVLVRR